MRLGIGSAQFGLDYGVANSGGRVAFSEVEQILRVAKSNGVRILDTAALYGNSEEVIGRVLKGDACFAVVTKTPQFGGAPNHNSADELEQTFHRSLAQLKQSSAYALLIHNANDLLAAGGEQLFSRMLKLQSDGLVEKVGVSVYDGDQVDAILKIFPIEIVQVPINVLDQRLVSGGQLARLKKRGVEIHARSIFLQGLLLMDPDKAPQYFDPIRGHLRRFRSLAIRQDLDATGAALSFVSSLPEIDVVVCGIDNAAQLEQICARMQETRTIPSFESFAINDPDMVNPSRWRVTAR